MPLDILPIPHTLAKILNPILSYLKFNAAYDYLQFRQRNTRWDNSYYSIASIILTGTRWMNYPQLTESD